MAKGILAMAALAALLSAPALAAGSGGGAGLPATSSGPRVDPAQSFREGVDALKAEDYKKAERKFGEVLSVAPKHPEANYYMALAKIGLGKEKQAVKYLEKAIGARGNFVEAREKLAVVQIGLGKPDVATEQLAEIEKLKTDCASSGDCDDAYIQRVDLAIQRVNEALQPKADEAPAADAPADERDNADKADEAAPEDQQALFFAPRDKGASLYVDAVKLINQANYEGAIAKLEKAQGIVGPHPDILNYLGYSNRKLGRMDEAISYYRQALAIDPNHKGANEYLGELYLEIGKIDLARKQLARLDQICAFGCAEREDLARLINLKAEDRRASR